MGNLYRLSIWRKTFKYSYDERGQRVNEREDEIETVINDIPLMTVNTYLARFPKNRIEVTRLDAVHVPVKTARRDYYEAPDAIDPSTPICPDDVVEHAAPTDRDYGASSTDVIDAAITGDFAAAINAA